MAVSLGYGVLAATGVTLLLVSVLYSLVEEGGKTPSLHHSP